MGEASSCVFQDIPLSSSLSSTTDRMAGAFSALGESVTFGRFLSESLDWGRWSSFNQKKYIEEAERYSQPGLVAQKKALFEARYKNAAHLRRSISLMQHTPSSGSNDFDPKSAMECGYSKDDLVSRGREESTVDSFYSAYGDSVNFDSREEEEEEAEEEEGESEVEVQKDEEAGQVVEESRFLDCCLEKIEMPNAPEKQPLQESSVTNQPRNYFTEKIPTTPSIESTKIPKPSFIPSSFSSNKSSYLHRIKENISTSRISGKEGKSVERKRPTPKSLHASINHPIGGGSTPSVCSSEDNSVERKRSTLKSVHASIKKSSAEGSTPSKADVKTKIARFEAVSKTTQSSMFSSKATKTGFPKLVPKVAPLTPQSEHRKTAWDRRSSFSGRQMDVVESDNLSTKNLGGASNKVDRLNGESAVSLSLKSDKKDMAENEMREFRRSLCFKARPLPDFYRKMEPIKESNQKITPIESQSPASTRISSSKEKPHHDNSVSSQKPPLSRSSSSKSNTGAPNAASFLKDQNNKWTFTFSRR